MNPKILNRELDRLKRHGLIPEAPILDITATAQLLNRKPSTGSVFTEQLPLKPQTPQITLVANLDDVIWVNHVTTYQRGKDPTPALVIPRDENHEQNTRRAALTTHVLVTRSIWLGQREPQYACDGVTWLGANECLLRHTITPPKPHLPYANPFDPEEWQENLERAAWPVRIALEALANEHRNQRQPLQATA